MPNILLEKWGKTIQYTSTAACSIRAVSRKWSCLLQKLERNEANVSKREREREKRERHAKGWSTIMRVGAGTVGTKCTEGVINHKPASPVCNWPTGTYSIVLGSRAAKI